MKLVRLKKNLCEIATFKSFYFFGDNHVDNDNILVNFRFQWFRSTNLYVWSQVVYKHLNKYISLIKRS